MAARAKKKAGVGTMSAAGKRRAAKPAARSSAGPAAKRSAPKKASPAELVIPASMKPMVAAVEKLKGVTVEKGWGSSSVALKVRGKVFAMLVREGLVFKLPASRVDALVAALGAARFDPRGDGRVMKEWLVLPPEAKDRVALAREALEFVGAAAK